MLIQPLPCATTYIDQLCEALRKLKASAKFSMAQKLWLTTVLMGIVVTRKLNWAAFERSTLNEYRQDGLRWMFSHSKMPWESLISASTKALIKHYGITSGTLAIDDSERIKAEALVTTIEKLALSDNPRNAFESISRAILEALPNRPSSKHMAGCDLGRQEPTESLKYKMAA